MSSFPLPSASRYQAPDHERADASAPVGGAPGRARLHRRDAHPEGLGYRGLLRCSVYTRDPREGRDPVGQAGPHSWKADDNRHSVKTASVPLYHSPDTCGDQLRARSPSKIRRLHYDLMSLCGTEHNVCIRAVLLTESRAWLGCPIITLACRGSLLLFMQRCGCKTICSHSAGYHHRAISPSAAGVRGTTSSLSVFL